MLVLIMDDRPLAQTGLANILSARSDVSISIRPTMRAKRSRNWHGSYDVLLLDINDAGPVGHSRRRPT